MKTIATRVPPANTFVPVKLELTIESEQEFRVLYGLGNYAEAMAQQLYRFDGVPVDAGLAIFLSVFNSLSDHLN